MEKLFCVKRHILCSEQNNVLHIADMNLYFSKCQSLFNFMAQNIYTCIALVLFLSINAFTESQGRKNCFVEDSRNPFYMPKIMKHN